MDGFGSIRRGGRFGWGMAGSWEVDWGLSGLTVYQGVRWSAAARYGDQLIRLAVTVVLVRLLDPADFGLFGMAMVTTGLLAVIRSGGLAEAVVQRPQLAGNLVSSLHWASVGNALLLWAVVCAAAPLVAWAFGDGRLAPVIVALGLTNVITALGLIPKALLSRQLAFKTLGIGEIGGVVCYGIASITAAAAGWQVWALVAGNVAYAVADVTMATIAGGWRPRCHFQWSEVRSVARFGAGLTFYQVVNYLTRKSDDLVIGLVLGPGPLGIYKLGYRVLLAPLIAVSEVLNRVLFPVLSRAQEDDERVRQLYLRTCAAIALATFPMMAGLLAVTEPLVHVLFGPKWLAVIPVLKIFAPVSMFQAIATTTGHLYITRGRTDLLWRFGVGSGLLLLLSFVVGVQWGILGVATGLAVATLLMAWPTFAIPFSLIQGLSMRDLLRSVLPALLASALMAIAVFGLRLTLAERGASELWQLLLVVPAGVVLYAGLVRWICPRSMDDVRQLVPSPLAMKSRLARPRTTSVR